MSGAPVARLKAFPCADCGRRFRTAQGMKDHAREAHGLFDKIAAVGPACIECGSIATLVGGLVIYPSRPDLAAKRFWLCACGAYCGCHGMTTRPLGNPCGPITRRARQEAHVWFDPIWQDNPGSRTDAYAWLARELRIDREVCHIGMMTAEQARETVRACQRRQRAA